MSATYRCRDVNAYIICFCTGILAGIAVLGATSEKEIVDFIDHLVGDGFAESAMKSLPS